MKHTVRKYCEDTASPQTPKQWHGILSDLPTPRDGKDFMPRKQESEIWNVPLLVSLLTSSALLMVAIIPKTLLLRRLRSSGTTF